MKIGWRREVERQHVLRWLLVLLMLLMLLNKIWKKNQSAALAQCKNVQKHTFTLTVSCAYLVNAYPHRYCVTEMATKILFSMWQLFQAMFCLLHTTPQLMRCAIYACIYIYIGKILLLEYISLKITYFRIKFFFR